MFQGTITKEMVSVLKSAMTEWQVLVRDVYQGCSGAFTVEKALSDFPFRWHGNDVSLYSCALGAFYTDAPFRLSFRPEMEPRFGWLRAFLDEDDAANPVSHRNIATILLLSDMLHQINISDDELRPHVDRKIRHYQSQFAALHAKTLQSIQAHPLRIASFTSADVVDWMQTLPREAGFVSYPPFYTGGYERMFRNMGMLLDWDEPEFQTFDDDRLYQLLNLATEFQCWFVATNRELPAEWEPYKTGYIRNKNRDFPVYMYSNQAPVKVVSPNQELTAPPLRTLEPDAVIGSDDRLAIRTISATAFNHLRSQYLSHHIRPGEVISAYAITAGNRIIGAMAFAAYSADMNWRIPPKPFLYMMSDFPVAPSKHKRLAKLVLYAALSKEMQALLEKRSQRRIRSIVTTAFTPRPTSMKYRGLFKIVNSKPPGAPVPGVWESDKYLINYWAPAGQWSLDEGLREWHKRYAHAQ